MMLNKKIVNNVPDDSSFWPLVMLVCFLIIGSILFRTVATIMVDMEHDKIINVRQNLNQGEVIKNDRG